MCLRCGCNGQHLKADGSCGCGCPALVISWDEPAKTIISVQYLKDMQPSGDAVVPPSKNVIVAVAPNKDAE